MAQRVTVWGSLPARVQAPVYILFACAVASRDLLLVVYDIPSVSICRGSQRRKAAENLGLPATAFADIEAFGGHIPECNAMRSADGGAGAAVKRPRTSSGGFGGLQGGPEASPLARASLSQPLDTLIGGLAGGGAGGLGALSKGSGDAGSPGASRGGFPEVRAGAQGAAARALLSTLAATPPNLGVPHEQGTPTCRACGGECGTASAVRHTSAPHAGFFFFFPFF